MSGFAVATGDRRRLLHLLWIAVVALLIDLQSILGAKISRCGVSGCSGGGFGVSADPGAVVAFIVGALGAVASWAFVALQYAA